MDSPVVMWVGLVLLVGAVMTFVMALAPRRNDLPLSRRRPDLPPPPSLLTRATTWTTEGMGRLLAGRSSGFEELLYLAGIRTPVREVAVMLVSGTIIAFTLGLIVANLAVGLLLAVLVPGVFRLVVALRRDRRRAAFTQQLSEILQTMAANLRAGTALPQAMQVLATEAEEPARSEFVRVGNELRVGRPMNDALNDVARRMDSEDFGWVAQAIAINREVGGNLADVLDGVANTMRERAALRRQVDALSAEGRMSGWVLMALPFGVFFLISLSNPGYFGPLVSNPLGWVMIAAGVVLLVIGSVWLNAATKIKY